MTRISIPLLAGAAFLFASAAAGQDGQRLSAEEIARLMDNPVGELIQLPIQYDWTNVEEPFSGADLDRAFMCRARRWSRPARC